MVWALEQQGSIACTVGAYAMADGQAYMACGETVEPLRGKGIGGRLIVRLANSLSAQGLRPLWLCSPERVSFYTRLGFTKLGEYARYEAPLPASGPAERLLPSKLKSNDKSNN